MMTRLLLFIFFVSSPLAACAQTTIDDETMQPVASALTKVAAAVDAYVAWTPGADALSSTELLYAATAHDPALLVPFEDYLLKTSAQGRASAVLVCTADGRRALVDRKSTRLNS